MIKRIIFFVLIGFIIASCNNEVDLNDEYQEITVVYGLLNPKESRHFIKIIKAFQSDGNVYISSQDPLNSEFSIPREVWMEEWVNGNYVRNIYLDTVIVNTKDSGIFYYPTQVLYATPANTFLVESGEYKLFIKNKNTGKIIESKTTAIGDLSISRPAAAVPGNNFAGFSAAKQTVEWRSANSGKLYQFSIRFFYHNDSAGITKPYMVNLSFPSVRSEKVIEGQKLSLTFVNSSFYENLKFHIPAPNIGVVRYVDSIQYVFDVADEDFTVYMDVNAPSNSIVQERPAFTNIAGGIGIFASRTYKIRTFDGLQVRSQDSLMLGMYTNHLGFKRKL